MKICPVGAKLFCVNRWTDKEIVSFHSFANVSKSHKQVVQFNAGAVVTVMEIKLMLLYRCKRFEVQHSYQMSPSS
jgi:hypothetical protein